jgi:hypothetical protein
MDTMTDRQFLQSVLNICATNIMADWTHTELSPNEEFEEMYKLIFERLNPPE